MVNKIRVAENFGKHSSHYDKYAHVQKKMADYLIGELRKMKNFKPKRILEIGCGTGYVTQRLFALYSGAVIEAVDISPGMIRQALNTIAHPDIEFICADIETMPVLKNYDLIISSAVFQWLDSPQLTINRLMSSLSKDGVFAFTVFCDRTFYEFREAYRQTAKVWNYPGLDFYTVPEVRGWLNFSRKYFSAKEWLETEYFQSARDFLDSIRKIGAAGNNGRLPVSVLREILRRYEKLYMENGRVKATYHCFSCISVGR